MAKTKRSEEPAKNSPYTHCKTRIIDLKSLHLPPLGIDDDIVALFKKTTQPLKASSALSDLQHAVNTLQTGLAPPVAFPTETVYGLAADATRSSAVRSIFAAKSRPSDNPLIVHVATLSQLHKLLRPLPEIYLPLIQNFWPGPLTILLPLPSPSPFAPEVTAGRNTVGIRMPATPLARLLIALVDKPLAAPSANASTRPSPTTAQHVLEDLNGRINFIIDGGPCEVGVESTVVDGLCDPPEILRPGGVGIEQIKGLGGVWKGVVDRSQHHGKDINGNGDFHAVPRAPGMKYRHYSPKARVVLFEAGGSMERVEEYIESLSLDSKAGGVATKIGIISTLTWTLFAGLLISPFPLPTTSTLDLDFPPNLLTAGRLNRNSEIFNMHLPTTVDMARYLFAALRTLDQLGCDTILVEGIKSDDGDLAAAVMNRVRKAAEDVAISKTI